MSGAAIAAAVFGVLVLLALGFIIAASRAAGSAEASSEDELEQARQQAATRAELASRNARLRQ